MRWLRNFGIGVRLTVAFSLVALLLIAVAVLGMMSLRTMNESMRLTVEGRLFKVLEIERVKQDALRTGILVRDATLNEDPVAVRRNAERIGALRQDMRGTLDELGKWLSRSARPEIQETYRALIEARNAYDSQLDTVLRQLQGGEFDSARSALVATLPAAQAPYFDKLSELSDGGRKVAAAAVQEANASYEMARNLLLGLAAAAVALAAVLGIGITRSITRPARQALDAAQALAHGNLTYVIHASSDDEMGRMLGALERAFGQLATLVHGIQGATRSIDGATREIAKGNTDLSQRTEEQAASLEQTAASMEQLTSTVKQNAANARHANELAVSASGVATAGGHAVRGVVETMQHISQSSAKVAEIVGVIEGIAFQTNILALNAAVEAARAGEQGRGFGVVAAEVRSLAQRSSSAAKEIGQLINGSVGQVAHGAKQVEDAGRTMDDIVGAVKRVTDIMGEIAAASEEQSCGIEQVNRAINQMESVTQQNAALVEQAAAAAESLQQQAAGLVDDVSRFQVTPAQTQVARAPAPVVAPARVAPAAAGRRLAAHTAGGVKSQPPARPGAARPTRAMRVAPAARAAQALQVVQAAPAAPAARVAPAAATKPAARPAAVAPRAGAARTPREPVLPSKTRAPVMRQGREPVLSSKTLPAARQAKPAAVAAPAPRRAARTSVAGNPAVAAGDWESF
ncbi:methyl-accepting chemotaxis protein [Cupriavidus basilensis]|uniref:methyl-accepting chemotaxis protein n=1 Tax=Cupriavidus basilensis TaxID=68895 RepID=UPI00284F7407|nr:methyl-accepting chemotaxis protein [Cupriavidus basilensis]MDR3384291.1 methyl-accepting chemotaxis protein [Cupriavidus basilensis]